MPGEVTQIIIDDVKVRMTRLEDKLEEVDTTLRSLYRMEAKIDSMVTHMDKDDFAHKELASRVLKCETSVIQLRTEMLSNLADIEKKLLKWIAVAAAASGGAGATILKALSFLG